VIHFLIAAVDTCEAQQVVLFQPKNDREENFILESTLFQLMRCNFDRRSKIRRLGDGGGLGELSHKPLAETPRAPHAWGSTRKSKSMSCQSRAGIVKLKIATYSPESTAIISISINSPYLAHCYIDSPQRACICCSLPSERPFAPFTPQSILLSVVQLFYAGLDRHAILQSKEQSSSTGPSLTVSQHYTRLHHFSLRNHRNETRVSRPEEHNGA
jgi:hypothetical protein